MADAVMVPRLVRLLALSIALLATAPAPAFGSQLIDRNVKDATIYVNSSHQAVVQYLKNDQWHHVIMWGAINALPPSKAHKQVKFHLDYSGGYGSFGTGYWKQIVKHNVCGPYTGPALHWKVAACTTPNGQNWALQSWQRMLPNSGFQPKNAIQSAWELQVSHWAGQLPVLWLKWDWIYAGRFDHLYGKFSYDGVAVHGFGATSVGNPTDSYGRNIYVDTLDPRAWTTGYRQAGGWMRFNSFLAHNPHGNFCAGVYTDMFGRGPAGTGTAYRASAMGPGVTPIVLWAGPPPGHYEQGGFGHRGDGAPDYNAMPSPPVMKLLGGYSKSYDQDFTTEERAVAGSGDSCYMSAAK